MKNTKLHINEIHAHFTIIRESQLVAGEECS